MRDGTGFIQAIVSKAAVGDEKFKHADHLSQETAVIVHGTVRADSRAPGGYELDVSVWIGMEDYYPRRAELSGRASEDENENILRRLDLSRFNVPVNIVPPQ